MLKGCQCINCEHRTYCNKQNKGMVVNCSRYKKGTNPTNKEFVRNCSDEELIDLLWNIYTYGIFDEKTYNDFPFFENKEDVAEWLSEEHKE